MELTQDTKICTKCEKEKQIRDFYRQKTTTKKKGTFYVYKSECKDCTKENSVNWNGSNKDKVQGYNRDYYKTDKGKENRKRKKDNQVLHFENFMTENPEYARIYSQSRNAKKKELDYNFTSNDWKNCLDYFNHSCAYCGIHENEVHKEGLVLEQEHVIPVTKNGGYTVDNIVPACKGCNMSKFNNDLLKWYPSQRYFNEDRFINILNYIFPNSIVMDKDVI